MLTQEGNQDTVNRKAGSFTATRWSLVLAARNRQSPRSREALIFLCEKYWRPLHSYIRRRGYTSDDAQDLTQEFFTRILEKDYLKNAEPGHGHFRSFLLSALNHFLANEWDRSQAQKRGGQICHVPILIQTSNADDDPGVDPSHDLTPEKLYERKWAVTVLDNVMAILYDEYVAAGKGALIEGIKTTMTGGTDALTYRSIADELGISEGAVKVAAHRLRKRFRETLRAEIAQTVAKAEDVEAEIHDLFLVLRDV